MPITELARLTLLNDTTPTSSTLREILTHAKSLMESYTSSPLYYLHCIEDPSAIYILGSWASLSQHYDSFIPGAANQDVVRRLEGLVRVEWLLHADVDASTLSFPGEGDEEGRQKALGGERVWSIVRHFVREGEKEKFQRTFDAQKRHLQEFVTEGVVGGGWRLDREKQEDGREKEEFVLFTPWTSVGQHEEFATTPGFEKYGRIREHIDGAEIVHVRLLDI